MSDRDYKQLHDEANPVTSKGAAEQGIVQGTPATVQPRRLADPNGRSGGRDDTDRRTSRDGRDRQGSLDSRDSRPERPSRDDARAPGEWPSGRDENDDEAARTVVLSVPSHPLQAEREWAPDDRWVSDGFATSDELLDSTVGLTSLGYIRAALRRRARVWCTIALIGLLAGTGYLKERPPAQEATTTLILASPANAQAGEIENDQIDAESLPVARLAVKLLTFSESPTALLGHYTATVGTSSEALLITVKAKSSAVAVAEANALAKAFLQYQKDLRLNEETALERRYMHQTIAPAQHRVSALAAQISAVSAQPATAANTVKLHNLQSQHAQALKALASDNTVFDTNKANADAANQQVITGSYALNGPNGALPVIPSKKKALLLYVGGGLVGGLALGMGIVIIGAVVSDRLRRRDDIARVLGIPVRLSVGTIPISRWNPAKRGLALAKDTNVQRVVEHLHGAVRQSTGFPATLAVIPVDDVQVPAICLVTLALACAQQGLHVVLADLCPGAPAAGLLHATEPGVRTVSVHDAELVVVVPDSDDVEPVGPLLKSLRSRIPKPLVAASATADMLLTLGHLDPALGGSYLSGWATTAIAMVTAGRSSAGRIYAVGEMIHQSAMQTASAVLLNSDKNDESLGVVPDLTGGASASSTAMIVRTRIGE